MKTKYEDENLDYQDFSGKCLIGVKFIRCFVRFCSFDNSDLSYATFESCDLYCTTFSHSIIYTTRILNCDLTKADFSYSYLNGIRISGTVVTYTKFGNIFATSKERKQCKSTFVTSSFLVCETGASIGNVNDLETQYKGIHCTTTKMAISFIEPGSDDWRIWRRKSEIAKSIKSILEDNGYNDKSLDYYYFHRKFLRKSIRNSFRRFFEFFWGELFWGYGVKISNPISAFVINCFVFSLIYSMLPFLQRPSGIQMSQNIVNVIENDQFVVLNYLKILYSSILISTLSVFGDIDAVGWAKFFSIIHVIISVLSLGLGIAALTKKLANV